MIGVVPDDFVRQLGEFGALEPQLVDLAHEESPRTLRYVDLVNAPAAGRQPAVFEVQGQPRAYVFDGRDPHDPSSVTQWVRRIAFRGDAEWVGVLRPGRLDVFRAALDGSRLPTPLADLPAGPLRFPALLHKSAARSAFGVRARMLDLLRRSIGQAKEMGVASSDALSLVGRALFWRFLIDRGLLQGLRCQDVSRRAASWPECLTTKTNALETFDWLNETFNGSLLPFASSPLKVPAQVFREVVGNIAHLADAAGQLSLRLPDDWSEVNFAHVPVGLLSEVYEAYVRDEDAARARAQSIFYTPRHIAEFVVDEALDAVDDVAEPRVLDPAAGAGVFLVAAFRALVAREWIRTGTKPSRKVVRRILNRQLTGFDINDSGLRLAELALYLTAIELDPEAHPRPLKLLKFEELRDRVLFHNAGGSDVGSLAPIEDRFRAMFDVVLGNPPWTAHERRPIKRKWTAATQDIVRQRLGDERAKSFDFPDTNPDLPFVYRAMEWAKPGGAIALITHARWLFGQSDRFVRARRDLFESVHVTGLLNGAELRKTNVWPSVESPFCLLFAANEKPPPRAAFRFVSPQVDTMPGADQERIRIDWRDASEIESTEAIKRPWTLKGRFRGTAFDEGVLNDLQRRGVAFGTYLEALGTKLRNGYQIGLEKDRSADALHMLHLPDLVGSEPEFFVDAAALPKFRRLKLRRAKDPLAFRSPLLLVHESMRIGTSAARAALCFDDVAFDERFDGVSFADVSNGDAIARYLQLLIQSSTFEHTALLLDGQYGVEREVVHLETIKAVPVVPWDRLSGAMRTRGADLSARLRVSQTEGILAEIDRFAFDVFELSNVQREAIADTLATALPTVAARRNAVRPTSPAERATFAQVCEDELRSVLQACAKTACVRLRPELNLAVWQVLQIDRFGADDHPPPVAHLGTRRFFEAADDASASLVTVRLDPRTTLVALLDRYRYWTRTRARLLAASLLSEPEVHA